MILQNSILVLCSYCIGSIPTGLLLAKAFGGVDIRTKGSGNIGATNVYRTLGRKIGIMTLIGDCLKGLLPVLAAKALGLPNMWVALIGLAAFLGHIFPVFLRFKGGKGVATALGVFLATSPFAVLAALGVFILVLVKWRFVSLASITAAAVMPALTTIIDRNPMIVAMSLAISIIVIIKHHENIRRLRNGTESKFKA
ncbi:MAG: glycerol-3-phosphate 1-O-acyltransferase PlsY [Geobacteraceae bacterium]|nr:glycerol-3-phosphate 1-O-acyltransferase PlsY [Geobacteraceae bacterium]